jgi:hypothetical protein
MNSYVIFTGKAGGWLYSDYLSSKVARALYAQLTRSESQGGTRVVRGWADVENLQKGANIAKSSVKDKDTSRRTSLDSPSVTSSLQSLNEAPPPAPIDSQSSNNLTSSEKLNQIQEKHNMEDYGDGKEGEREIQHLLLVIHG